MRVRYIRATDTFMMNRLLDASSPYAVPAGHSADLSELIAYYKRKNDEMDRRIRSRTPEQIFAKGGDYPPKSSKDGNEK